MDNVGTNDTSVTNAQNTNNDSAPASVTPSVQTSSSAAQSIEQHPADDGAAPTESSPKEQSLTSATTSVNHINDCDDATLDLYMRDAHGDPIPNLAFRVMDLGPTLPSGRMSLTPKEVFKGKTDARGRAPLISGLKVGTRFEVQIKKDDHSYKLAAIGPVVAQENTACLQSPKVRFEFSTLIHHGSAGHAEKRKEDTVKSHNQKPEEKPNISRHPDVRPTVLEERNKGGHPMAIVKDGLPNMYGQHAIYTAPPNAGKSDLEKVKALIEFGMEQAGWKHTEDTSAAIIEKMKSGKYQIAETKEANGYRHSVHKCTKYVKIAIWHAGYSHNGGDIAPKVSPARDMGPALVAAGFTDITATLPDGRWASPGDIIVYKQIGTDTAAGHIDIRSYDGYISDFFETYLPITGFEVLGIYRKYYDPLPEIRVRAFLKVIRSREAETVMQKYGDDATYRAMPLSAKKGLLFDGFSTHPFDGNERTSTPSGAYGITLSTWRNYTHAKNKSENKNWVVVPSGEQKFSPKVQDRIAVAMMEQAGGYNYDNNHGKNALAYIRCGNLEKALQLLNKNDWPSLPGGPQSRGYTMTQMMTDYETFLSELTKHGK
jgi:muramidase (phage lysozyme)